MGFPEHPPASFFEEVGRLCGAWAYLEHSLQRKIWELLGIEEDIGQYVTYGLDAKRRWEVLVEVASTRDGALHAVLKANQTTMEKIAKDRNLVVHGLLTGLADDPRWHWIIYKGARRGQLQPASEEFIVETSKGIRALVERIRPRQTLDEYRASVEK